MANNKKFVAKNGLQTQNILLLDSAGSVNSISIASNDTILQIGGTVSADGQVVTTSSPILNLTQTWYDSASSEVFTAFKMNITDSASSVNSVLMDLQVDAQSMYQITTDHQVVVQRDGGIKARAMLTTPNNANGGVEGYFGASRRGSLLFGIGTGADFHLVAGDRDSTLRGEAVIVADVVSLRDGTNPQEFRVYGTYTDASNYERLSLTLDSKSIFIAAEAAGTGTIPSSIYIGGGGTLVTTGINNVSTGYQALYNNTTGNRNVATGYRASYNNTTGSNNVSTGYQALRYNTTGINNVAIGYQTLYENTTGGGNVATGSSALSNNTTGSKNVATGQNALVSNTSGINNVGIGYRALQFNNVGSNNVGIGYQAQSNNRSGINNVGIGYQALQFNTTGSNNVATGHESLYNTTGSNNVATGHQALYNNTTGSNNVGIGLDAGRYITDGTTDNETGSNSIFIGQETKANADGESNQIVIGYDATGNGSNTVTLGNDSITETYLRGAVTIDDDVLLHRDAAQTLALRDGTNPNTFNIYGTYTDASNNELISIGHDGSEAIIASEAAGTGTARDIVITSAQTTNFRNGTTSQVIAQYNTYENGGTDYERARFWFDGTNFNIETNAAGTGAAHDIRIRAGGQDRITATTGGVITLTATEVVPDTDDLRDLGSVSSAWASITGYKFQTATKTFSTSDPAIDITQTWYDSASSEAFTAFKMNITDSASSASSALMDLQINSAPVFNVNKSGQVDIYGAYTDASNNELVSIAHDGTDGVIDVQANGTGTLGDLSFKFDGTEKAKVNSDGVYFSNTENFCGYVGINGNVRITSDNHRVPGMLDSVFIGRLSGNNANANADYVVALGANAARYLGTDSVVAIGYASGLTASDHAKGVVLVGPRTKGSKEYSSAFGHYSKSDHYRGFALSGSGFGGEAESTPSNQFLLWQPAATTTDATATELFLHEDAASDRMTVADGKMYAFEAHIVGVQSDGTDGAYFVRRGIIANNGGTTALIGSVQTIGTDIESNSSTDVSVTADDTNDALSIEVTGIAAETWRWSANVLVKDITIGT